MKTKIVSIITIVSLCLLFIMLNLTTPATAGPFGILAIFAFAYMSLLGVVAFFIYNISRLVVHLSNTFMFNRSNKQLSIRRSYYYSTVISAAPIMIVALQSVGTVGIYEFLLIFIFILIGCLYISKKIN